MYEYDVAITGNLCDIDILFYSLLRRYSIKCIIIRHESQRKIDAFSKLLFRDISIEYYSTSNDFNKLIKKTKVILSFTGSYLFGIGRIKYIYSRIFKKFKVINCMTGSDFIELPLEKSIRGLLYKDFCKSAFMLYLHPIAPVNKNIESLKLNNYFFARFPFFLPKKTNHIKECGGKELTIIHPSNLDWGSSDFSPNRISKGNDKFIRSVIRALKNNVNLKCIILDRGPDRDKAKSIINNSGFSQCFKWIPHQDRESLWQNIKKADLVVDQFDMGCFGMISMEAMAQAKPVMIYIDKNYWPLVYDEEPPVINCHTEDEIYHAILEWADKKKLQELGERAEKWVRKYHDVQTADFSEFILRVCLAAGLEWPRKDLAKQDL